MTKYTRSEFLRIAGAGAAATGLGFGRQAGRAGSVDASRPDVALVNGHVLTMDQALPRAEAFAIKSGRFVAIGSNDDIRNIISSDTEVIDSNALAVLASACRDHEEVRFDYRRRDGEDSRRLVEPHQMVTAGRRWYLVAWDLRRDDWRTFRLDRLSDAARAGRRFTAREIPGGDAADFVATSLSSIPREIEALVAVGAPFTQVEDVLRWTEHSLVETEPDTCVVRLRTDNLDWLVLTIAHLALTAQVTVVEPAEVADAVGLLAERLTGLVDTAQPE